MESETQSAEIIDIFVVVKLGGDVFSFSFWTEVGDTADKLWKPIAEYVSVELRWRCEDLGLPVDLSQFESLKVYSFDRDSGLLSPLTTKEQFDEVAKTGPPKVPLALFDAPPDAEYLKKLKECYLKMCDTPPQWDLPRVA